MKSSVCLSQQLKQRTRHFTYRRILAFLALALSTTLSITNSMTTAANATNNSEVRKQTRAPKRLLKENHKLESNIKILPAASILTVDNTTDDGSLSGCTAAANDCSLRGAIANANNSAGDETITFDPVVFGSEQTITLGGTQLTIENNGSVTINGGNKVIVSANNQSRVFQINGAAVATFNDLKITGGNTSANGGGIDSFGTVTATDLTISGNSATGGSSGGGISNEGGVLNLTNSTVSGNSGTFSGGGIHNNIGGTMNIVNSTISGNTTGFIGGGIRNFSTMNLTNVTISANSAAHSGGGIFSEDSGVLSARNSIIAGNTATAAAPDIDRTLTSQGYNLIGNASGTTVTGTTTGNILNQDAQLGPLQNNGGSTLTHAPNGNSPARNAGNNALAVDQNNQPLTTDQRGAGFSRITGGNVDMGAFELPTVLVVDTTSNSAALSACTAAPNDCSLAGAVTSANNTSADEIIVFDPTVFSTVQTITSTTFPAFTITNHGALTIDAAGKIIVSGNNQRQVFAINSGANVTFNGLTVSGGFIQGGFSGGGIINQGTLNVTNSTISGNSEDTGPGGGGIFNQGTLNVTNSAISGNTVSNGGSGSGIYNTATLNLISSTVSGNSVTNPLSGEGEGGGVYNDSSGTVNITNSTISGNFANHDGGGFFSNSGTVNLTNSTISGNSVSSFGGGIAINIGSFNSRNSIIAGNTASKGQPDFGGTLTSQGYNLIGNTSGTTITGDVTGNILNQNAGLAPLGNYGGATFTQALLSNSPAINAGTSTNAPVTDQRGANRVGNVDIGAFEVNASFIAVLPGSNVNQSYSQTIVPNRSDSTYSVSGGTVPPGLNLDAATAIVNVSGTPTTRGTYNFDITANRSGATSTIHYSIVISGAPTISDIADTATNEDTPTGNINFTVSDLETPAASLLVTATSGNQTLVPNANISLGGADGNRTINITPAANQNGSALITVTVTDGGNLTATDTFTLTVNPVNDAPTISDIANTSTNEDTPTGNINFTVSDIDNSAASLIVSASSDNQTLVPNANITLGGSGSNRTINIAPAANQNGSALITVTVTDPGDLSGSDTFTLTVNPVNDAPTVSDIPDTTINEDTTTGNINFTVSDLESPAGSLIVTASSNNQTLVPDANITLGGSGGNRTINITPAANQNGSAIITVVASDGSLTGQDTFTLTVNPVNDAPTVSDISNTSTDEDTPTGNINFTVSDVDNPAGSLVVTGSSDNQTLVPNANISFGGSGANRTINITPAQSQFGSATITVIVSDGALTGQDTFVLTVNPITFIVDNTSDNPALSACTAAANDCSLRGAIAAANASAANNTVRFDPVVFSTLQTITLSGTQLTIENNGTLTISGAGKVRVSGNNQSRVLQINSGAVVTLDGLTITGGNSVDGGGISNGGTLTVTNSTISGNSATNGGAGFNNNGTLNLINSTVSGNSAATNGGGVENNGTVNLTNATISTNSALVGGGFHNNGTVNSGNSIIAGNTATNTAPDFSGSLTSQGYNLVGNTTGTTISGTTTGNIVDQDAQLGSLMNNGGGTFTHALAVNSPARNAGNNALAVDQNNQPLTTDQRGTGFPRIVDVAVDMGAFEFVVVLTVDNTSDDSTLSGCTAAANDCSLAGAITNANNSASDEIIVFDPSVFSTVQTVSSQASPAFTIANNGALTILGGAKVKVSGNNQKRVFQINSGANVTFDSLTVTAGSSNSGGGGISNAGTLNLINSTISGNSSTSNTSGGGIFNTGTLNATNSTISGNSSTNDGGGVSNRGGMNLTNSTITGNSATTQAGGFFNNSSVNMTNSTITENSSDFGGGFRSAGGTVNSRNSIIAGNTATTAGPDLNGTLVSQGYNLIGSTSGATISGDATGNILNQNAKFAPLGNYGGPTFTHALLSSSPAVNAGTLTNAPATDQRGAKRVAQTDMGAFELSNPANGGSFVAVLPDGVVNQSYSQNIVPNKLDASYSVTTGNLPPGLTFDAATAAVGINGTPTTGGSYNFDITATRSGSTSTTRYSIFVSGSNTTAGCPSAVSTSDATITFGCATQPGTTTFAAIDASSAGTVPGGYTLCPTCPAYDISTTALYAAPITVCLAVPSGISSTAYATLKLLHGENGNLFDRTTSHFTDGNGQRWVCGGVSSLSPFVLGGGTSPTAANGTITGHVADLSGAPIPGVSINLSGAEERLAITDANGNYLFDNLEANSFFTITPLRTNYSFNPMSRSFSLLGAHVEASFAGAASGQHVSPLDTSAYFVRQQYLDFLNREPDEAGFNFWVNNIESCGDDAQCREVRRINTSAAFFLSVEFQQTGYLVYRFYKESYGFLPNEPVPVKFDELLPDTQEIGKNVIVGQPGWEQVLEFNKQSFVDSFVQRQRFVFAYPTSITPASFVDALFTNADVAPTSTDRAAAIAEFGAASNTGDVAARARALRRIAENSTLSQQEFNRAFVLMQYFGYLRRNPKDPPEATLDFQGYNFWLDRLNAFGEHIPQAEMVKAFLSSVEYCARFPR
jgi:predicted outer membrane repeat protein